ncbi:uncharacterized protein LOC123308130 isoform X2 [Coccinella septempunctata]|nr:uncharacterized protein LOC123308130 isoform X2 [Coccinella septempunctata]XP_044746613.1 uncharacterized protein LOC123308130 isoform X2 [Coccinella septempunctata]
MKIFLHLTTLIYLSTMTASRSMVSKESSYEMIYNDPTNRTAEKIFYDVAYKALASPDPKLISTIRCKLKEIGAWLVKKESEGTFIGRCFGVARQIKFAMPIIMVKLGVIVTILVFLTIFSMKTMGLLLVMFMFGASSAFTKLALWKTEAIHHQQKPQNVHFHIHPGKHGEYNFAPAASPWERTSSENNFAETDAEFQEKMNYLAKYQKGLFDT